MNSELYYIRRAMYYIHMSQPKTPPLSIRPGAERLAAIDAEAARRGVNRHAAVLALIDLGLARSAPVVAAKPAPRVVGAAAPAVAAPRISVSVPLAGTFERKPYQKTPKR